MNAIRYFEEMIVLIGFEENLLLLKISSSWYSNVHTGKQFDEIVVC